MTAFSTLPRMAASRDAEYIEKVRRTVHASGADTELPKRFLPLIEGGQNWEDTIGDFLELGDRVYELQKNQQARISSDESLQALAQLIDPGMGDKLMRAGEQFRDRGMVNFARANLCDCAAGIFDMIRVGFLSLV